MRMQCAVIAVSAIEAAGVMRDRIVSRLDMIADDTATSSPPPMLILPILAALIEQDHSRSLTGHHTSD